MIVSIPIYIEERREGTAAPTSFLVRPLFFRQPLQRADRLSRALRQLAGELQQFLRALSIEPSHEDLADWTFHPLLEEQTLELRLDLASGSRLARFFLAGYAGLGRKLWFCPSVPGLLFEVFPRQSLEERALAVFTHHFRNLEREDGSIELDEFVLHGRPRLSTIEISLQPGAAAKRPRPRRRALLFGGEEKKDGEEELRKTGRLLQTLYPDDLDRAVGREPEVEELARLLAAPDRRPILLVGPRKVGKTTIIHELVWQMRTRKEEQFGGAREVWLLSPMRLISGMSYLGEWENRVLAILDYAGARDRVLYFDDLPGLLTAGRSSASDLSVAQVLQPFLEKRSVRVVAEITPESWRVLREQRRTLADLFHVIPVEEPSEHETLRILVDVSRHMEERYRCAFALDAVPTVYDLHRRFIADAAFPGKAAGFLRRLAVRRGAATITRSDVLSEFCQQSGLQMQFLDPQETLKRDRMLESLRTDLAGQDSVLQAFADILLTLKARLNDPRRPLGTLLLLGPTGVGKTQSAKALARYLFGNADRLLRFDLNEFVEGASAGRLVGTLDNPEGLLTGAVRRQPFSVLLFDEIEKAAPEVFDVLLAVLDEGRLVDALGRVADFTNTVILLTSNLGMRESRSRLGFGASGSTDDDDGAFLGAAEKFFRPEFFNRIDRIIPFRTLTPAHLENIAQRLLAEVFARDGLRRRDCVIRSSRSAIEQLVASARNSPWGARALKRAIEKELAQPLAERLAVLPPATPTIAHVESGPDRLVLTLEELRPAARSVFWPEAAAACPPARFAELATRANAALDRIEAALETRAPTGKIELGNLPPGSEHYFACREQLKKTDRLVRALERFRLAPAKKPGTARIARVKPAKVVVRQFVSGNPTFSRLRDRVELQLELAEWEAAESVEVTDSPVIALCRELALLEAMVREPWSDQSLVLVFQALDEQDGDFASRLGQHFLDFVAATWGGSAAFLLHQPEPHERMLLRIFKEPAPDPAQAVFASGFNLAYLLPTGVNTVLVRREDGSLGVLLTHLREAGSLEEARTIARAYLPGGAAECTHEIAGPVLHMITEKKSLTDFRSGVVVTAEPSPAEFRALALSVLPLPAEVEF